MPLEADDLALIREWVGSTPPNADLGVLWEQHLTVYRVSLAVLRARMADYLERGEIALDGFMREGAPSSEALKTLRARIAQLEGLTADEAADADAEGTGFTGRLVRRYAR